MNLISANATNNTIFDNITISSSCIVMFVVLTKERSAETVAEHCGFVLIHLSQCSIVLLADLLIFNPKEFNPKVLCHLMTELSGVQPRPGQ